jgi:hypothetical protein
VYANFGECPECELRLNGVVAFLSFGVGLP